jgi:drug/metabolite transporter (DMT)-like permease
MDNDKMNWPKVITIIGGLAGITLVAFGRQTGGDHKVQLIGVLFLLITNIAGSFNNILVVREKDNIPPLIISSFSMFVGGLGIWLFSIPMEGTPEFIIHPLPYYEALAWLSFVSAAGVSIWTKLLKRPGIVVSELNFWKFLVPVS